MLFKKYIPKSIRLKIGEIHYNIYGYRMPWSALRFEIHLTDKCNLNCAGCLHFSSLCEKLNLISIQSFENDIKRLSILTNGRCADIRILGGEPLLHPEINCLLKIARNYFPVSLLSDRYEIIELVTNGILLPNQPDDFWEICCVNNIRIVISDYPVKIDKEYIKEKARKYGVQIKLYEEEIESREAGSSNQWVKIPIDTEGKQNYKKSFGKCFLAGSCFQLVNGKLYKCARIAYINYFNEKFNQRLEVVENDYIDIYKANNIIDILNELTNPPPFCRYCKVRNITWNNQWKKSRKSIDEYV
ncbi:MAG: 4Fe-4S cluster-binding domain-containing protein [Tannerella sp.]|jgi:MoaA/NifB/PqqE/SkfB family radical SAM enzyme|nr:4Fe-4S cluster-binding domain-containing protein [Tannerella sp.]